MLLFLDCYLGGLNNKVTSYQAYTFHQTLQNLRQLKKQVQGFLYLNPFPQYTKYNIIQNAKLR